MYQIHILKIGIWSVLEQSLTSSAKIEKTLDSLYSETMPVTIPSAHKQINLFFIDFNIYFALKGASKVCLFKTLSLAVTRAKIYS